ncbi:GntR family transcriptional regulator [Draconibacterium sp. IB214405]|uniref:GntR family transcriptional regulator n=1 Tax=Draconibacterium sp. IB214405 TaxID=3097352 RepID=UPI002A17880C|nr:GntR family transcriptional regulator [Draconibacterium sp. IB214405]MDX8340102.1 GntR family transcriptional regulator [Draconibacterium sp. IB214405]
MARKKVISLNPKSAVPKYRQIIDSVYSAIERRSLKKGDKVPSINQVCAEYNLSRDTVMYAFNELKSKGILKSQPGKGYYIASTEIQLEERVFVLFDELNAFKEDLYNSLINSLKGKATVEVYFHHFNYKVFKNLITESIGNYTSYLIMPATFDNTSHLLSKLPQDKVYIIDRLKPDLEQYPVVYQDFYQDFYDALVEGKEFIKKYRKLVFVNPGGKEPVERSKGFERFCTENKFKYEIVKSLSGVKPSLWEAYFLISDRDLVEMVKIAKYCKFKLGKKFGVVSFNDTMLKEVVAGGITTISTDFKEMGKTLSNMVLKREKEQIRNKAHMIFRNSL